MPFRIVVLAITAALLAGAPADAAKPKRPDLVISTVSDPPAPAQPGSAFSVTARLRNRGSANARSSTVAFLLSTDRRLGDDDVLLATARRGLRARRSSTISSRLTIPVGLPAGTWLLLVCADRGRAVKESKESNNCRAAKLKLDVKKPAPVIVTTTTTTPAPTPPSPAPDTTPPAAPTLTASLPSGVGADESPLVTGTSEAGARLRFFTTADCSGTSAAATTAASDGSFSAGVPVPQNAVSALTATATDAAGNVSPCSDALTYEQDAVDPDAPVLLSSTPASPAAAASPTFKGTAEPSTIVTAYFGAVCNGDFVAQTVADVDGNWELMLALPHNTTTEVTATATDPAGHISRCSSSRAYRHDDVAPTAAVITNVAPGATGSLPTPVLNGTAEPGADVLVFTGAGCAGTALLTTTANGNGAWSAPVDAALNGSRSWSARARDAAGNPAVNCSNTATYVHDDVAPAVPAFATPAINPPSPSPDASPIFSGTGDPGSILRMYYGTTTCAGSDFLSTLVDENGEWSIEVLLSDDAQNMGLDYSIRGRDAAGNMSACAAQSVTYVHDNAAPAVTGVTWPASPSSSATFAVTGHTEPGADVFVFGGTPTLCTTGPAATILGTDTADQNGDFSVSVTLHGFLPFLPADDGEYPLGVASRDAAKNLSDCPKSTYVLDTHADAPQINDPVSPGGEATPFIGGGAEPGAAVKVYETGDCTGPATDLTADEGGGWGLTAPTAVTTTAEYSATQTDLAGNTSSCSGSHPYERDTTPPAAPVLVDTVPASGSTSQTPYIRGTSDENTSLTFYASGDCDPDTVFSSGVGGAAFEYPGAQVFVNFGTTVITATAADQVGNTSACSNAISYEAVEI